jgi:formiminotetrahydrofolate cyclodeaminase
MMVAGLTKSRTNEQAEKAALAEARKGLQRIRDRLVTLADSDTEAFEQVLAGYRMPRATDEEKRVRHDVVQRATRAATEAPFQVVEALTEALKVARVVAQHGNRAAVSDVRVALELLEASAAGAAANVEANLTSLDDQAYREKTAAAVLELTNGLSEHAAAARSALK